MHAAKLRCPGAKKKINNEIVSLGVFLKILISYIENDVIHNT